MCCAVQLAEVKEQLQELLERIPDMWTSSRINDNCGGAAIAAAVDLLKPYGGKVHALLSGLPSVGVHALKTRDGLSVGDKEKLTYLASQVRACGGMWMWMDGSAPACCSCPSALLGCASGREGGNLGCCVLLASSPCR